MAETSPPPDARFNVGDLRQLAALCCDSTQRFFGIALDFSPASLSVADRLISQALEVPEPSLGMILPWGAYLGEVAVRHLGARWVPHDNVLHTAVAAGERTLRPFRRAAQRLSGGPAYSLEAAYQELAGRRDE